MKKLLVGLLALGSISTFASTCEVSCFEEQNGSILNKAVLAVLNSPNSANQRDVYKVTCEIIREDGSVFYKNSVQGIEIIGWNKQRQLSGSALRRQQNNRQVRPSAKERKLEKQSRRIQANLRKCQYSNY